MTRFVSRRLRFWRDHRWAPDCMSSYLDSELGEADRRRMERHVSDCSECRRLLSGLRTTVEALGRLSAPRGGVDAPALALSVRARTRSSPPS
jgi:anti-sigma factor RsiW